MLQGMSDAPRALDVLKQTSHMSSQPEKCLALSSIRTLNALNVNLLFSVCRVDLLAKLKRQASVHSAQHAAENCCNEHFCVQNLGSAVTSRSVSKWNSFVAGLVSCAYCVFRSYFV